VLLLPFQQMTLGIFLKSLQQAQALKLSTTKCLLRATALTKLSVCTVCILVTLLHKTKVSSALEGVWHEQTVPLLLPQWNKKEKRYTTFGRL
jgi:hypothetical protein